MATTRAERRAKQKAMSAQRDRRCAPKTTDTFADLRSPNGDWTTVELGCVIHRDRGTGNTIGIGSGHVAVFRHDSNPFPHLDAEGTSLVSFHEDPRSA